jgi:hypothetical protein
MNHGNHRLLAGILAICAVSDLAAVPLLAGGSHAPAPAIGIVVAVIGISTAVAAWGVLSGAHWGRPAAWVTRIADAALALGAIGAGGAAVAAAGVTIALSVAAIALLARSRSTLAVA